MHGKRSFFILLALSAVCTLFTAALHAQLIEPTRSLKDVSDGTGLLNVLSEPPGTDVQLDGKVIGKTPIFYARLPPGVHVLRIGDSETEIRIAAGKTFAISWFKGAFIEIPEAAKPPSETARGLPQPGAATRPEEPPAAPPGAANDPYYWPLNPRGPIY